MANTIKVGVLGCGNMGRNHLRVLSAMPEVKLVGVFDPNGELANQQAGAYGIEAFASADELYAACEAVHIVAPSSLHRECAIAAAKAGCHVLVEKPIALNQEDAQAIIDACREEGRVLAVGHVERFNPAILSLADILKHEEIVALDFQRLSPFDGRISDADVVQDLMIHDLDVLNSIMPFDQIESIQSSGAKVRTDMLDYAHAVISYKSGVVASLTASRLTEAKVRKLCVTTKKAYIVADYLNRTVEISRKTNFNLDLGHEIMYKQENIIEKVFVPFKEPLRSEFEDFACSVLGKNGEGVAVSGEMGKQALSLCEAISR